MRPRFFNCVVCGGAAEIDHAGNTWHLVGDEVDWEAERDHAAQLPEGRR